MTPRSLKALSASSWAIMLLCALVLFYLGVAAPNVISSTVINDRDKDVAEVRAMTDLRQVQQIATFRIQGDAYVTDAARMLLIISAVTLVLCMVGSGIGLWQIRRLRRQMYDKSGA